MTLTTDPVTGVLKISGTLDIDAANRLREALLDCCLHQPEVAADLSEVESCDAAGLQVLLAGQRGAAAFGKVFSVRAAATPILETAAALGLSLGAPAHSPSEDGRDATQPG
jgi:anti-anti-sigma regulatory factor